MSGRFLLAIPVLNEERHVQQVLRTARRYIDDILVVDDGSTDRTAELLGQEEGVRVIRHRGNRGYGASLRSAFRYALCQGFEWLITMDCDEQHEPSFIPKFRHAAEEDTWDIISGSRYSGLLAQSGSPPADRREINRLVTRLLNDRLGYSLTDSFCGFKAYHARALRSLTITECGYAVPLQLWVQAWRAGLRVRELPVRLIYNDPTRHFSGILDDPVSRYQHYLAVFEREMAEAAETVATDRDCGVSAA